MLSGVIVLEASSSEHGLLVEGSSALSVVPDGSCPLEIQMPSISSGETETGGVLVTTLLIQLAM